ncbi:ORFIII-like polyprotein [Tanacetum coccineum]
MKKKNAHRDKRLKPSDYELVRKIKLQVQNLPDLEIPLENAYIILETDGCMEGWGGIVKWKKIKEDPRSSERIYAYASGKFSITQSTINAEINACINTLEKFKICYLDKQEVTLRTDCQAIIIPQCTKTIFTPEEPGALYKRYQLKANQTPIRMDKSDAWRSVAQDLELSAAKEAVKAMQNLQAIIQCKAQICFGQSTKDNHWSTKEKMFEFKTKKPEESSSNLKPWHKDWDAIYPNHSEVDAINEEKKEKERGNVQIPPTTERISRR